MLLDTPLAAQVCSAIEEARADAKGAGEGGGGWGVGVAS